MDKIKVSDEALRSLIVTLEQLENQTTIISSTCIQQLTGQLSELETNFKKDIMKYSEDIKALNDRLMQCIDENVSAISERIVKLAEYETQTYQRRNIG